MHEAAIKPNLKLLSELITMTAHKISQQTGGYPMRPKSRVDYKNYIWKQKRGILIFYYTKLTDYLLKILNFVLDQSYQLTCTNAKLRILLRNSLKSQCCSSIYKKKTYFFDAK